MTTIREALAGLGIDAEKLAHSAFTLDKPVRVSAAFAEDGRIFVHCSGLAILSFRYPQGRRQRRSSPPRLPGPG